MRGDQDEVDSEVLLKQGDELLRSSRQLLDDLEEVVAAPDASEVDTEVDDSKG